LFHFHRIFEKSLTATIAETLREGGAQPLLFIPFRQRPHYIPVQPRTEKEGSHPGTEFDYTSWLFLGFQAIVPFSVYFSVYPTFP
jgi:hypothetical protein